MGKISAAGMAMSPLLRAAAREDALKEHILSMPANLLREYLCAYVDGAPAAVVESFVVALHAQNKMPQAEVDW